MSELCDTLKRLNVQEKTYKDIMRIFQPYVVEKPVPYTTEVQRLIAQGKYAEVIKRLALGLIPEVDLNTQDYFGDTPLMFLLKNGEKTKQC